MAALRKRVWIEHDRFRGWGCSEYAWVFNPCGAPSGKSFNEAMRNFELQRDKEFTLHVHADCRGVPVIYYGTEQYLHNDTNGGNDPFNRPMMSSYDTTTTAYKLISKLTGLRKRNTAIPYGTTGQRWINNEVYIYERAFAGSVILVGINKNDSLASPIGGLLTALPAGTYTDYLGGLLVVPRLQSRMAAETTP